jgi:hypothetical protein
MLAQITNSNLEALHSNNWKPTGWKLVFAGAMAGGPEYVSSYIPASAPAHNHRAAMGEVIRDIEEASIKGRGATPRGERYFNSPRA